MMTTVPATARLVLLDPDQCEQRSLSLALTRDTYKIAETNTLEALLAHLRTDDIHLCLIRHTSALPDIAAMLQQVRRVAPATEVIVVMPDSPSTEIAAVLAAGAFDCLTSFPSTEEMMARARRALEHRALKLQYASAREHAAMSYGFDNLVGPSDLMDDVRRTIARLAPTDIAVMIVGDPGTGKDLCAHIMHHHSNRRTQPLVTVDCAVPDVVLAAELFGSDASDGHPGLIRQADGGTLFLNNLDAMPPAVQKQLLSFLLTSTLPSGDKLNVRLLSATTIAPESDAFTVVRDLTSRLNTITLALPTLAERIEDIPELSRYLLRRLARETGRSGLSLSQSALDRLVRYRWTGNIGELETTLRRAAALSTDDTIAGDAIVFLAGTAPAAGSHRAQAEPTGHANRRLSDNERELIERALVENDWNNTRTARELGIGRTTLWRKVKKYDLKPETTSG